MRSPTRRSWRNFSSWWAMRWVSQRSVNSGSAACEEPTHPDGAAADSGLPGPQSFALVLRCAPRRRIRLVRIGLHGFGVPSSAGRRWSPTHCRRMKPGRRSARSWARLKSRGRSKSSTSTGRTRGHISDLSVNSHSPATSTTSYMNRAGAQPNSPTATPNGSHHHT
jgi:hypothetical protein